MKLSADTDLFLSVCLSSFLSTYLCGSVPHVLDVSKPSFATDGRIPLTKGRPVTGPLRTQYNTTQKDENKYPYPEREPNPRS